MRGCRFGIVDRRIELDPVDAALAVGRAAERRDGIEIVVAFEHARRRSNRCRR